MATESAGEAGRIVDGEFVAAKDPRPFPIRAITIGFWLVVGLIIWGAVWLWPGN